MRVPSRALPALGPSPSVLAPRLLDVEAAARYLGDVSPRTVRTLIGTGVLRRVRLPLGQGELRRVLLDRCDLDRLIEAAKPGAEALPERP